MGGLGTGTVLAGFASSKYSDDLNFAAAARQIVGLPPKQKPAPVGAC
jgi:hypothetical protein